MAPVPIFVVFPRMAAGQRLQGFSSSRSTQQESRSQGLSRGPQDGRDFRFLVFQEAAEDAEDFG